MLRWAVVQLHFGCHEPWFAVYGTMPEELILQRTIERAEMCALHMVKQAKRPNSDSH